MSDPKDPQTGEKEFMETLRKMMSQLNVTTPEAKTEKVNVEDEEKRKKERKEKLSFTLKPKEVKKHLDQYVIKQEDAKRVLATAVCDHYNHIRMAQDSETPVKNYAKQNVVMLGPTGVGKTYLIKSLSELIGVPFVKADATKFSETGYVGGDVEDLVRELVHKADGDIELAQCGMVYIDEIDKIATGTSENVRDVSGSGVQRGLLKIMEETEVSLRNPQDMQAQIQSMMEFQKKGKITKPTINTKYILFIVSGSFTGMTKIIERRLKKAHFGFSNDQKEKPSTHELLSQTKTQDFTDFGFEPEFVGRLPVRVICSPLKSEDLYSILKFSEGSVIKQYKLAFKAYGIDMEITDDALWEIAKKAAVENTGARGLVTVCEQLFRDLKYELPSSQQKSFKVTKDVVLDPTQALEEILREEREAKREEIKSEIRSFESLFASKHNVQIEFDANACGVILDRYFSDGIEVCSYLEGRLSNYGYGLGLIQKKKNQEKFVLGDDVIKKPNQVLEEWIKESYER